MLSGPANYSFRQDVIFKPKITLVARALIILLGFQYAGAIKEMVEIEAEVRAPF